MTTRYSHLILTLLITLVCWACSDGPTSPEVRELTVLEKRLVQADNKFGFNLFQKIVDSEDANKNIFISPLSVSMALGMTLNGADGQTQEDMEKTLEFAGMSTEDINQSYRSLIDLLTQLDPKVVFEIANSIWYRQEMTFEKEFMDLNRAYFDAMVQGVDFGNPEAAADLINSWVKDNTRGKIEEIVVPEDITWNTVMFLINAIYFKGTWTYEFDKKRTREEAFRLADNSQKSVQMMHLTGDLNYFETESLQAIDLPYGDAEESGFSMTILLPKSNTDVNALINDINESTWQHWLSQFSEQTVDLAMPKFKLELKYDEAMKAVLTKLGMGVAFTDHADFTKMYKPGGLFIEKITHKTFVEVNEEGTEAAAVTSVEIDRVSLPNHIIMRVDRPFVFVIRESHSQSILFMGKISEPS